MRIVNPGGSDGGGGSSGDFNIPEIDPRQIRRFISILLIFLLLILAMRARPWFTVSADEQAVVLRLGRLHRLSGPGFHFKLPLIETVHIEAVTQIKRIEIGFRSIGDDKYRAVVEEALMVTGDGYIVDAEMIAQYQIVDPFQFRYNARDAEETLKDVAEAALRQVVGDRLIDTVWIDGRTEVETEVRIAMQEISDAYGLGVSVRQVQLQDVGPPKEVITDFLEVQNAKELNAKLRLEAEGYREGEIPKAEADVAALINEAIGHRAEKVSKAKGDVERFDLLLSEYRSAEEVTQARLYLETMERVLQGKKKIIVAEDGGTLPLLNLTEIANGTK